MVNLLTGENSFMLHEHLQHLVDEYDGTVDTIDASELGVKQLPDLLTGVTLFSSSRLIVFKYASANKVLWSVLSDWLDKGVSNDLVFVEPTPDKRTKTYKWLQVHATVTDCKELQFDAVVRWVKEFAASQDTPLDTAVADFLVQYVGVDQWRLKSELEKLKLSGRPVTKDLVRELVEPTSQATSFEVLDAAFAGEHERLERVLTAVEGEEDPYMFFGLLAGQVLAIAAVKFGDGKQPDDIARDMGIHPFVVRKVSRFAQSLSQDAAKQLVARLSELDVNMKSRSVDPWTQVRSFLSLLHS